MVEAVEGEEAAVVDTATQTTRRWVVADDTERLYPGSVSQALCPLHCYLRLFRWLWISRFGISQRRSAIEGHRASGCALDFRTWIPKGFGLWYRHEVSLRTNAGTEEVHLAAADLQFRFVA